MRAGSSNRGNSSRATAAGLRWRASYRGTSQRFVGMSECCAEVPLREHAVEMSLCGLQPAMNKFADVLASPGFRIATDVVEDESCAETVANDLASLAGHISS